MQKNNSGQVLLLVLLAMAAVATMALSVVSRSITGVTVSTRDEESLRAFSAAEAGVEQALVTGTQQGIIDGSVDPIVQTFPAADGTSLVSSFTANIERYPPNASQFNYPFELESGESGSVWLATKSGSEVLDCSGPGSGECFSGASLNLCWGKVGSDLSAVMVNILYKDATDQYATRPVGYDPDPSRRSTNNFLATGSATAIDIDGQAYAACANLNLDALIGASSTPILMRVTSLYNTVPQIFGVSASSNLPIQGRKVSSTGVSGDSSRKIDAFLLNPEVPFIFDAAVYSEGGLTK